MKTTAIYGGTFDPVTYGHLDLVKRGVEIFDSLILAVAESKSKNPLFTLEERIEILKEVVRDIPGVEVDGFNELLVDYARRRGATVVLRGLRAVSDFEYEFQMALTNRKLDERIETIFMMPKEEHSYMSSRILKEIVRLGADISCFVPPFVKKKLEEKLIVEG